MLDLSKQSYRDDDGYTYHYYKCDFNENDYITGIEACDNNPQEADIFEAGARFEPDICFGCYKVENNQVVYDEQEYNRIIAQREQERREKEIEDAKPQAQLLYTALMTDTLLPEE